MKKRTSHIDLRALFLALMIFLAFSAKEMHHLVGHSHQEVKICDALKGETHLHDQDYIPHECQLCDFTFSIFDISIPFFKIEKREVPNETRDFTYLSYHYSRRHLFQSLRGPPALVAII